MNILTMLKNGFMRLTPFSFKILNHNCDDHWYIPQEMMLGEPYIRTGVRKCGVCKREQYAVYHKHGPVRYRWVNDRRDELRIHDFRK
jgi:hypothetical protein